MPSDIRDSVLRCNVTKSTIRILRGLMSRQTIIRGGLAFAILAVTPCTFAQDMPAAWHLPLTSQEVQFAGQVMGRLMRAPDFPKLKGWHVNPGSPPERQINAFEQSKEIFVPVEMFRFTEDDPSVFTFLIAHEAGHAKQEEIYGQSCYTAGSIQMSKFDWIRALADIAGGAATQGAGGATTAAVNMQKQACEDNADAWAVRFMREAGLDATGGIRLFEKLMQLPSRPGWQHFAEQFTSDHSINELRIAHVTALILQKRGEASGIQPTPTPQFRLDVTGLPAAQSSAPIEADIVVTLNQSVSSKDAQTGQTVAGEVAEDVIVKGVIVIPKGSKAVLSLGVVRALGSKLWLKVDLVELKGRTYPVSSGWSDDMIKGEPNISLPVGTKLLFRLKSLPKPQ
jgi:hypothetical protein